MFCGDIIWLGFMIVFWFNEKPKYKPQRATANTTTTTLQLLIKTTLKSTIKFLLRMLFLITSCNDIAGGLTHGTTEATHTHGTTGQRRLNGLH